MIYIFNKEEIIYWEVLNTLTNISLCTVLLPKELKYHTQKPLYYLKG